MKAKEMMSKGRPEVYLDLDGVVADFFDKYAELAIIHLMMEKYGKSREETFKIYHGDEARWQDEFGIRSYRDIPPAKGDPVLNMMIGTDFFNRLPKFGTADALVGYLVKTFGSYKVLSSPLRGDYENSEKYKKAWVARELKPGPSQVIIEHRKEKYARQPDGTPNILIDDRGNNITNWEAKGGIGIKYQADEDSLDKIYDGVERAFRIIKGEEEHVPQVIKSKDRTKTIATGDDEKSQDIDQVKESAEELKENFVAIFTKFLPLAMKVLQIDSLPKMKFEITVDDPDQPTFGRFDPDNNELTVALGNRHPNDILRTVAHELVHYKQGLEHQLDDFSGETGSDEENQANAVAGVIMRHFNKQYPEFLKQKPLMLGDLNERRRRRKRRWAAYGPGPYGWYGYDAGYSGDSGGDGGGSVEEAWSEKYKRSINCSNPKGFSQKAHCAGRKKRNEELEPKDVHKLADKKGVKWDMDTDFMAKTRELTGKKHLDDLDQADLQKVVDWLRTLDEGDLIPLPKGTVKVDVSDVYDWYKLGMHISDLKGLGKHDFGKGPPQTVMAFGSEPLEHEYIKYLNQIGLKTYDIDENFADSKGRLKEGLSWSSLDDGLSVEDKISIFEEYLTKGNLIESNDDHAKKHFLSLFNLSDLPKKNEEFIVAPLVLVKNQISVLDKRSYLKYLGKLDGQMIFTDGAREIRYPSKAIRDLSIFNTFTFSTHDSYDKFRTILALKFNSNLPTLDENFADGKVKGKSRPGRVKKAGASCKGSVSDLRSKAKKYGGEKGKMYHWCANMKGGKKKK